MREKSRRMCSHDVDCMRNANRNISSPQLSAASEQPRYSICETGFGRASEIHSLVHATEYTQKNESGTCGARKQSYFCMYTKVDSQICNTVCNKA